VIQSEHSLPEPWLAHRTLATGAIDPKVKFHYAFERGMDLIYAGMYNFQIVEDDSIGL
jgi:hypothetical protein